MLGGKLVFATALMSLAIGTCPAPDGPSVRVDGKTLITSSAPTIRSGGIYVPITAFRRMGLFVDWRSGEKYGTVGWPDSDLIYDVTAGQSWAPGQIAGSRIKLPGTPFMRGNQLMVPLRTPVIDTPSARDFLMDWDARNRVALVRRSRRWLERRLRDDATLKAAMPGCYETPM